jgi:hypothetical protein
MCFGGLCSCTRGEAYIIEIEGQTRTSAWWDDVEKYFTITHDDSDVILIGISDPDEGVEYPTHFTGAAIWYDEDLVNPELELDENDLVSPEFFVITDDDDPVYLGIGRTDLADNSEFNVEVVYPDKIELFDQLRYYTDEKEKTAYDESVFSGAVWDHEWYIACFYQVHLDAGRSYQIFAETEDHTLIDEYDWGRFFLFNADGDIKWATSGGTSDNADEEQGETIFDEEAGARYIGWGEGSELEIATEGDYYLVGINEYQTYPAIDQIVFRDMTINRWNECKEDEQCGSSIDGIPLLGIFLAGLCGLGGIMKIVKKSRSFF